MARAAVLERLIGTSDPGVPLPDPQTPAENEGASDRAPSGRAPLDWRLVTVLETVRETPRTTTLVFDAPGWPGHRAGQHVDLRLTAEDGYQAQRSYSIASAPEEEVLRITVDRLDDGEVSPFLTDDVLSGDELELRGPIGGPFTWAVDDGGPLLLLAGGSGIVPLMAMLRHRAAQGSEVPARLLHSVRTPREAAFRRELLGLSGPSAAGPGTATLDVRWTFTRMAPPDWDGFSGRIDDAMLQAFEATEGPGSAGARTAAASAPSWGGPGSAGQSSGASGAPARDADATDGAGRDARTTRAAGTTNEPAAKVFVCGPTGFVETAAGLLVRRGHDPASIRTERFGPS